jgi:hypothetical protein
VIAEHGISLEKGQVIKNTHHYRDTSLRIDTLENDLHQLLGHAALALCALLKASSPKIYKDQLLGAKQVLAEHIRQQGELCPALLERLIDTPHLTATGLRERLEAYRQHPERIKSTALAPSGNGASATLARYGNLNGHSNGQGERHVVH